MTGGILTYGFGDLSSNGFIVLYGFGNSLQPIVQLNFSLEIDTSFIINLER